MPTQLHRNKVRATRTDGLLALPSSEYKAWSWEKIKGMIPWTWVLKDGSQYGKGLWGRQEWQGRMRRGGGTEGHETTSSTLHSDLEMGKTNTTWGDCLNLENRARGREKGKSKSSQSYYLFSDLCPEPKASWPMLAQWPEPWLVAVWYQIWLNFFFFLQNVNNSWGAFGYSCLSKDVSKSCVL